MPFIECLESYTSDVIKTKNGHNDLKVRYKKNNYCFEALKNIVEIVYSQCLTLPTRYLLHLAG